MTENVNFNSEKETNENLDSTFKEQDNKFVHNPSGVGDHHAFLAHYYFTKLYTKKLILPKTQAMTVLKPQCSIIRSTITSSFCLMALGIPTFGTNFPLERCTWKMSMRQLRLIKTFIIFQMFLFSIQNRSK